MLLFILIPAFWIAITSLYKMLYNYIDPLILYIFLYNILYTINSFPFKQSFILNYLIVYIQTRPHSVKDQHPLFQWHIP